MQHRDIQLAALVSLCLATGNLAAPSAAKVPAPGSTTGDGFTVSALWHAHYEFHDVGRWKLAKSEAGFLNARRMGVFTITTTADADVTEEVNKQTGQLRAVLRNGEWHWQNTEGPGYKASGGFSTPVIGHWWDATARQEMVAFGISATGPANYEELVKAGRTPNKIGISCRVEFKTTNLTYRETEIGWPGTNWEADLVITRTAQKLEAEIKPTPDFKKWVPTMNGAIGFEVRMVEPPDVPVNWKISLYKVSNLPGVCCNAGMPQAVQAQWPGYHDGALPGGQQDQANKDASYDLFFDFRKYGKTEHVFKPVDEPWQVLETSKPATAVGFIVNCLDYGASGRVLAVAEFEGQPFAATYKGTGETFVRIPYSKSKIDEHRIADAAKPDGSDQFYPSDKSEEDQDAPTSNYTGDGLSVFEEYRGFVCKADFKSWVGGFKHVRLDPQKRDLFVFTDGFSEDLATYLPSFANASKLNVHWLGADDDGFVRACDSSSRNHWVVNFNSDQAKKKPQHALYLLEDTLAGGINGETCPDADCGTTNVGSPKDVYWIKVDEGKCRQTETNLPRMAGQLRRVVIHELGHGVGIQHHGNSNLDQNFIALEGGQNSGDVDCAMKYVLWRFYRHNSSTTEPDPQNHIYDPDDKERPGFAFCTSNIGNEYNKVGADGWQCGNAVRGNCLAQIRVNDASVTPQGGMGASGKDVADPGGDPTAPPNDDVENRAHDSQKRAGVAFGLRLRDQRQIIPGEAIIIEMSLRGLASKAGNGSWDAPSSTGKAKVEFGTKDCPWTDQVHFLTLDKNRRLIPLPAKYYAVGTPQSIDSSGRHEQADPKIELKPEATYLTTFAIDGSQTESWTSGAHRIFATVGSGRPDAPDSITSKSVIISLVELDKLPGPEQGVRRELSQGYVELAAKHLIDAEKHARAAISAMPDSHRGYLLLAESLEAQNRLKEAYTAYNEALTRYKPQSGVAEPPETILVGVKSLEEKLGIKPEPPPVATGPFATHSLFAPTATGKITSSFPPNVGQLAFEWQLAEPSNDPLGIRWIAENVGGVEKDHMIATAKSEANKQSGQFSLTKPTAGFPPGKYRVEIWQSGKEIYREPFEIR